MEIFEYLKVCALIISTYTCNPDYSYQDLEQLSKSADYKSGPIEIKFDLHPTVHTTVEGDTIKMDTTDILTTTNSVLRYTVKGKKYVTTITTWEVKDSLFVGNLEME